MTSVPPPPHRPSTPRQPDPVDPRIYRRLFEQDSDGAAVIDELWRVFSRSACCEGGIDAILKTYRNEGARAVSSSSCARSTWPTE